MQVNRNDVLNASYAEEIGKHASRNRAAMRFLLRLATVGKVGQDGYKERSQSERVVTDLALEGCLPVTLLAEPPLQAEIMMSNSIIESLTRELPDCTTNTSFSRTLVRIRTLVSPLIQALHVSRVG